MILFLTITAALTKVVTDDWQNQFFALTLCIIIILSSNQAIFQSCISGIVAIFPMEYTTALSTGQALSGVLAATTRIVSQAVGEDQIEASFIYFIMAAIAMCITGLVLIFMIQMEFYKKYTSYESLGEKKIVSSNWKVFKQIKLLCISACGVSFITYSTFFVCFRVISTSNNKKWADIFFQPVGTFLLFNVGDLVGRQLTRGISRPHSGPLLYFLILLRVLFIPLFLCCNTDLELLPSYFHHDAAYITLVVLFSVSNGYLSAICQMHAPKIVSPEDAEKAGMMMTASHGLGLLLGSIIIFLIGGLPHLLVT